jgi:hypothetical protein
LTCEIEIILRTIVEDEEVNIYDATNMIACGFLSI